MITVSRYTMATAALTTVLLTGGPAPAHADNTTITLTIDTIELLEHRYSTNCDYRLTGIVTSPAPAEHWVIQFFDTVPYSFDTYPTIFDTGSSGMATVRWRPLSPGTHQLTARTAAALFPLDSDPVTVTVTDTPCSDIVNLPQVQIPKLPPFQQIPRPGPLDPGPR
ncbi:hypothetical protein [Nocardia sp. NPDC004722]